MDSRPFGEGSLLHFADRDDYHDVSDDEDDATDNDGPFATEDDAIHATLYGCDFLPVVERAKSVYVYEQPGGHGAAVLFESHGAASFAEQVQKEKRMNEQRRHPPAAKRPPTKEKPRAEAHFDRVRAVEEMKKYVELCVRKMGLAVEYEVSSGAQVDGDASSEDVVVEFRGGDEALLLERHAELLLALEHIGHRWLRLDPRLHD